MIFLPSLLTDLTFTFRNILNHTLTVLKSSEKSKREQKAGLREYGLPWRSSGPYSAVYTQLLSLRYVRYDLLSSRDHETPRILSLSTTLDLLYFWKA